MMVSVLQRMVFHKGKAKTASAWAAALHKRPAALPGPAMACWAIQGGSPRGTLGEYHI